MLTANATKGHILGGNICGKKAQKKAEFLQPDQWVLERGDAVYLNYTQ